MLTTTAAWDLDVERGPDWLIVKVRRHRSGARVAPLLATTLWELMEQHFTHRLVLELNEVSVLDDRLIEELLDLHERICHRGGVMRVCGLSPQNRNKLLERHAADCFVPYTDREEAVHGAALPHQPR